MVRRRTTLAKNSFEDVTGLLTILEPKVIARRHMEARSIARSIQVASLWQQQWDSGFQDHKGDGECQGGFLL